MWIFPSLPPWSILRQKDVNVDCATHSNVACIFSCRETSAPRHQLLTHMGSTSNGHSSFLCCQLGGSTSPHLLEIDSSFVLFYTDSLHSQVGELFVWSLLCIQSSTVELPFFLDGHPKGCLHNGSHVESILFWRGGRKGSEKSGLNWAGPHACCWHAERDDVAESPMEILPQT